MAPYLDDRKILDKKSIKRIQSIVGTMPYYSRSFDTTIIQSINETSQVQSKTTRYTEEKSKMLLYYATIYSNAIIHYKVSDMILHMDSGAAYFTILEARSCYAGHFYLRYWPPQNPMKPNPKRNGPIHTECKIIRNIVSSEAEAETCGTFNNRKKAIDMRPAIINLDHKQPATTLKTDNYTTEEFVDLVMKPKH